MAKPEWGTKRVCLSCGARFYDFGRSPISCPACGTAFDLETATKVRRARPAARSVIDPSEAVGVADPELAREDSEDAVSTEADGHEEEAEEEATLDEPAEEEEEDSHLIEDTGDLGDDDDMSDVIDEDIDEEDPDARH